MARSTAPPSGAARVALAAALVVVASVAGVGFFVIEGSPGSPATTSDGPTLYQALAAVNLSVENEAGGPWGLFSFYGVATQVPFSPNVLPYGSSVNGTVNGCGGAFDGLTLWNGTIPTFDGTFSSGTAPFWQFAYFTNTSHDILLATDMLGTVRVYAPVPVSGSCEPWYDLNDPAPWYWTAQLASLPANSPGDARTALQSLGDAAPSSDEPWTEIYTSGPGIFGTLGDRPGQVGVYFDRCGEVNVSGLEPLVTVSEARGGQYQGSAQLNETCALLAAGHGAFDGIYALQPSSSVVTKGSVGQWISTPYQVALAFPNGTLTGDFDGWGLANWMARFAVTNSIGASLPAASPTCSGWQSSLQGCPADPTGWFLVVESAYGGWTNSYGNLDSGQLGWSVPVTALVSHQQVVLVLPTSWEPAGDSMTVSSVTSTSTIEGTIEL
jgi:hypothetical protein